MRETEKVREADRDKDRASEKLIDRKGDVDVNGSRKYKYTL